MFKVEEIEKAAIGWLKKNLNEEWRLVKNKC